MLYHGFSYPGVEVVQKGNGKRQIRRLEKTVIPRDLTPPEEEENNQSGSSKAVTMLITNPRLTHWFRLGRRAWSS